MASRYADPKQVGEFARDRLAGGRYTLFLDRKGEIAGRLGLTTYPQFVVLDARGRRVGKSVYDLDSAVKLVQPLLGA